MQPNEKHIEYRVLKADGRCACCGRKMVHGFEKAIVFKANKSQVGNVTICGWCLADMVSLLVKND